MKNKYIENIDLCVFATSILEPFSMLSNIGGVNDISRQLAEIIKYFAHENETKNEQ